MQDFIKVERTIDEVNTMSPLTWAYIGDNVYELFIRTYLINTTKLKPHELHIEAIKYVKAEAQAKILEEIKDNLTPEELDIVRRGRNAENHHVPKNVSVQTYMYATAFESLIGYLYLIKEDDRLYDILKMCLDIKTKE